MFQIRLFIGVVSVAFFLVTFELIRKRYLREEYAILWLLTSMAIAVLSFWPRLLNLLSRLTGLYYISAVIAIIFLFMVYILMHYSIVISRIKDVNKELAQRYALLELKIREMDQRSATAADKTGGQEAEKARE